MSPPIPRSGSCVLLLALLILVYRPVQAVTISDAQIDSVSQRIEELRGAGDHRTALDLAKNLLSALRSSVDSRRSDIKDLEVEVKSLEGILVLPESRHALITEADSLAEVIEADCENGDFDKAEESTRRQLAARMRVLGNRHSDVAESLNNLASILHAKGRYAEAVEYSDQAVAIATAVYGKDHPKVAMALGDLAYHLKEKGDLLEAEPPLRRSLEIVKRQLGPDHELIALSLDRLAAVRQARGLHAAAASLYREALAMRRRLLDLGDPEIATNMNNIAVVLCSEGDYAEAEPLYREALEIQQKALGPDHPDVASSLNNLAFLLQFQGNYAEAEPLYREALAIWRGALGPSHPLIAKNLSNLANTLQLAGDDRAAEPLYREAIAMYRQVLGEEHPLIATTTHKLGLLYEARDDDEQAERLFRDALDMRRRLLGPAHPDLAVSLFDLGGLQAKKGAEATAESFYREALAMRLDLLGEENPAVVQNRLAIGRLMLGKGDAAQAKTYLDAAARGYEIARVRAGTGLARAMALESPYADLAVAELTLGQEGTAWSAAERAQGRVLADLLLAARERSLDPREEAEEDSLAGLLTILEARVPELRKASAGAADGDESANAERLLAESRQRLLAAQASWSALQNRIAQRHPVTEGQAFPLSRIQAALDARSAVVGWLEAGGRETAPGGPRGAGGPGGWIYVVRSSGSVRWSALGATGGTPWPAANGEGALRTLIAEAGASPLGVAQEAETYPQARALWAERIEPALKDLEGIERLIVIPSGAMLGVPVEVLVDSSGAFLGDRFSVAYAPSGTVFAWLREAELAARLAGRGVEVGDPVLLVGDPSVNGAELESYPARVADSRPAPGRPGRPTRPTRAPGDLAWNTSALRGVPDSLASLPRLLWSRREVQDLARLFPRADALLGPDASEERIVQLARTGGLARYRILHFATHALVDDARPERSAIVLSLADLSDPEAAAVEGRRIIDGLLTAREIVREWRLAADLVTLSACETALGKEVAGEGYIGLAHALLQAGARNVLVSLWSVNDQATAILMRRFYESLTSGTMTKAESLREAKRFLRMYRDEKGRTPFAHPYYWAPFILIGEAG